MIKVVRKGHPNAVYCGRPSPLGNPFYMKSEADRDRVCDQYVVWFKENLERLQPTLEALSAKHKAEGVLYLACFCAPKRCHCDTIKAHLESIN